MKSTSPFKGTTGEVFRNVRASFVRSIAAATLAATLGSAIIVLGWLDLTDIEAGWERQVHAGVYAFSITTSDQTFLDAARCDELETIDGVRAAGAVLSVTTVYPTTNPRTAYLLVGATPGYASVAFPGLEGATMAGAVAGLSVSAELGLADGSTFAYRTGSAGETSAIDIDLAANSPSRFEVSDSAVIVALAPEGGVSECIVEAWPGHERAVEAVIGSWFPMKQTVAKSVARVDASDRDVAGDLRTRLSQWAPLVAAFILGGYLLLDWWSRRQEFALYRMLGMSGKQELLVLTLETLTKAFVPLCFGAFVTISILGNQMTGMSADGALRDLVAVSLCLLTLPVIAGLVMQRVSMIDAIKGR